MKKKLWFVSLFIIFVLLLLMAVAYSVRQVSSWSKLHVTPTSYGSEWRSEDGSITFGTFERYDSYEQTFANGHTAKVAGGDITKGSISVGERIIQIYVSTGHDGTLTFWLNDRPYVPDEIDKQIEVWKAIDYEETDTNTTIIFEVVETTYFEKGQVIKLIHDKAQ